MNASNSSALPAQEPGLDQRGADRRVAAGERAGLPRRAARYGRGQAGVEDVAQQPLGQRGRRASRRRLVKDHQVDVAEGGDVAPAIAAVGDQGDLRRAVLRRRPRPGRPGAASTRSRSDGVAQVAQAGAELDPGRPAWWRCSNSSYPSASRSLAASTLERREDMVAGFRGRGGSGASERAGPVADEARWRPFPSVRHATITIVQARPTAPNP